MHPSSDAVKSLRRTLLATATVFLAACSNDPAKQSAGVDSPSANPKLQSGMVVTANPLATRAGAQVLRRGGSAVDAAVAIESVLSLVEPQSSGFGGGGFLMHFDASSGSLQAYDGREVAPAGVDADLFLDEDGEVLGFLEAKNSGLSIGVPGVVAMLALAQSEHGTLRWDSLFDDAISLAENGFVASPRLRSFFEKYGLRLIPSTQEEGPMDAYEYFFDDAGEFRERLFNPAYAETLRLISQDPANLYRGDLAESMVASAQHLPRAGTLSLEDIAAYQPRKLTPICVDYRGIDYCGPPPPSSWIAVGMTLEILENLPFPGEDRMQSWAMFTEAQRMAYADRDHFIADDTAVPVPLTGLLNGDYLRQRAELISLDSAAPTYEPGDPWSFETAQVRPEFGKDTTDDQPGTTHFVVVDNNGNVVSMTATVESIFGSARMAGGMFLNNELTDFARDPRDEDGKLVANHPAPRKRPRSSMSPTIALRKDGSFHMATGSPGGNSIIAYTAKSIVGMADWNLSPQEAIDLPNVVARGDVIRVEQSRASEAMLAAMRAFGFNVRESAGENSGLSVILAHGDGVLEGGVDPRREGTVEIVPPPGER
ncbi:MAG: gamma-glutamyltransferase family protein [Pseudomonadota bacterium]